MLARHLASSLPGHGLTPAQVRAALPPGYKLKPRRKKTVSRTSDHSSDSEPDEAPIDESESIGESDEDEADASELDDPESDSFVEEDDTTSDVNSTDSTVLLTPRVTSRDPSPSTLRITRSASRIKVPSRTPSPVDAEEDPESSPESPAPSQGPPKPSGSYHVFCLHLKRFYSQLFLFL